MHFLEGPQIDLADKLSRDTKLLRKSSNADGFSANRRASKISATPHVIVTCGSVLKRIIPIRPHYPRRTKFQAGGQRA